MVLTPRFTGLDTREGSRRSRLAIVASALMLSAVITLHAARAQAPPQVVRVTAERFSFTPSEISVAPGTEIEDDVAVRKKLAPLAAPLLQSPNPGQQLFGCKGLDQIVVGAGIEPVDPIGDRVARGQEQDRQGQAFRTQSATDRQAVDSGHGDVEDDQVGDRSLDRSQRLSAVRGARDLIALGAESALEHPTNRPVVVDNENSSTAHVPTVASGPGA